MRLIFILMQVLLLLLQIISFFKGQYILGYMCMFLVIMITITTNRID